MKFTTVMRTAIAALVGRTHAEKDVEVVVYENPTEELAHMAQRGAGSVHKWGAGGHKKERVPRRDEENYLFSTRRFPVSAVVNPGPGGIAGGDYLFFNVGIGGDSTSAGFPTGFNYSELETNLQTASVIPQGQAFRMKQLGISFNAEALASDIQQVVDAGSILLTKQAGQWSMRHGPAQFWPGGMGVVMASQNQGVNSAHNGIADWKSARYLKIPRDIHNLENFNYTYKVPRSTRATDGTLWSVNPIEMRIWLWGLQVDRIPD
jgi:hypothetical protein